MQSSSLGSPWVTPGSAKTNGTSILALVSSLSGFVCFAGIGGVLGIVLGLVARNEIKRSEGRESGRALATAAIVVGVLNVACTVIGLAVAITFLARPKPIAAVRGPAAATAPTWKPPAPVSPRPAAPAHKAPRARASHQAGSEVTTLGTITLADISGDFSEELNEQRRAASEQDQQLMLWLVVPNCKPCDGVAAALTDPLTQKALNKVRLVRADRDEFQVELERLGIPTEKIPGFALLDAHDRPLDFIHGGEWDADIAANIAPVLGKFVHGSYAKRRQRWHGAAREDETQL